MIRHRRGNEFLLIAQHDHAQLAGRLAAHLGNDRFAPPTPLDAVVAGVALHDCGWPLHDDHPTLNPQGLPLHVLEVPMRIATRVWTESSRRATEEGGAYAGLLVSLHVLYLSMIAQRHDQEPHERYADAHDLFELNKFQHRQIEHQENLRRELGLRLDLPLKGGLTRRGQDPGEDLLLFNAMYLRLCDAISLDACASDDLFPAMPEVFPHAGAEPVRINFGHPAPFAITLDPWPFDRSEIRLETPCRRLPATPFGDEERFREAYANASVETAAIVVRATT